VVKGDRQHRPRSGGASARRCRRPHHQHRGPGGDPAQPGDHPADADLFILGDILGAGIYALTGQVAADVGGAIWASFIVSFLLALITALAYLELVTKYPRAAGAALYVRRAFHIGILSFMVTIAVMASGVTSASFAATRVGGRYWTGVFGTDDPPTVFIAILVILLVAAVNYRGVGESIKVNIAITLVELSGLLFIIAIGAKVLFSGDGEPRPGVRVQGVGLRRPHRHHRRRGHRVLRLHRLRGLGEHGRGGARPGPDLPAGPAHRHRRRQHHLAAGRLHRGHDRAPRRAHQVQRPPARGGAPRPARLRRRHLFSVIAMIAVSNTMLINMLMASRLLYGMANQGVLPAPFAWVSPRKTPWFGILFTSALSIVLIVTTEDLTGLSDTTVFLLTSVFFVVNICVLVLRRDPVGHSHFVAPAILPIIGAGVALVFLLPINRTGAIYLTAIFLARRPGPVGAQRPRHPAHRHRGRRAGPDHRPRGRPALSPGR
jgi:Amino acid permease